MIFELVVVFFANIIILLFLIFLLKFFLFTREISFLGYRLLGTPGFVYKKEKWVQEKANYFLVEYRNYCEDKGSLQVLSFEESFFNKIYKSSLFIEQTWFMPSFMSSFLRKFTTRIVYEISRYFLKEFLPYLMKKYEIEYYFEVVKIKVTAQIIEDFSVKYIFKYLYIFFFTLGVLLGIMNCIIVWLI